MSLAIINNNTTNISSTTKMESTTTNQLSAIDARRQIIKRKVLAIGKMSRSYTVLKEHPQLVKQLKTLSANGKLPFGTLASGEQGIRDAIIASTSAATSIGGDDYSKIKEQKDLYHVAVASSPNNYKSASRGEGHV